MSRRLPLLWLSLAVLLLGLMPGVRAYVFEGPVWPQQQPIVLDLQLGAPTVPTSDGSTSWNDVAVAAMNEWNPHLINGVQLQASYRNYAPRQGDGFNSVFFSPTVYGEDFGGGTCWR